MLTEKEQRQLERLYVFKKEWEAKMDQFEALVKGCNGVTANGEKLRPFEINIDEEIAKLEAKK